jgi:hypothetical protein
MTQQHPITPPPELIENWIEIAKPEPWKRPPDPNVLCTLAAQWGADRQLEADAEWVDRNSLDAPHLTITPTGKGLVEAMRSKLPNLKEQALEELEFLTDTASGLGCDGSAIRRALEQLPDSIVVFPSQY